MPSDGSPKDRQSLNYLLRSGLAGGVAGCVVRLFLFPPAPTHPLIDTLPRSVLSPTYHFLTALVFRRRRSSHPLTESRSSSRHPTPSSRSMQVRPFLYPTQRILLRRTQRWTRCPGTWSGAFRAGSKIYRENGIRGLLQGHSATLLRIAPYAAIKFMTYDQIEPVRSLPWCPPTRSR